MLTSILVAALNLTALAASMIVNALMTGLIVFKIFKVFLKVKAATTSVERLLGSTGGCTRFRHVIFVIIESGLALFAIQLVRVVLSLVPSQSTPITLNLITGINQMFNVIIKPVHFYFFSFIDNWLGHRSNNNFGAGFNEIVLRR